MSHSTRECAPAVPVTTLRIPPSRKHNLWFNAPPSRQPLHPNSSLAALPFRILQLSCRPFQRPIRCLRERSQFSTSRSLQHRAPFFQPGTCTSLVLTRRPIVPWPWVASINCLGNLIGWHCRHRLELQLRGSLGCFPLDPTKWYANVGVPTGRYDFVRICHVE